MPEISDSMLKKALKENRERAKFPAFKVNIKKILRKAQGRRSSPCVPKSIKHR